VIGTARGGRRTQALTAQRSRSWRGIFRAKLIGIFLKPALEVRGLI
jgi:hypothetical protein